MSEEEVFTLGSSEVKTPSSVIQKEIELRNTIPWLNFVYLLELFSLYSPQTFQKLIKTYKTK